MDILTSPVSLSNALSGAVADSVSTILLYPLSSVKTQLQVEPVGTTPFEIAVRWYKESGPFRIFQGVQSSTFKSAQQKFQYFYVYSLLKELYFRKTKRKPPVVMELLIGYISALMGLATTVPLESTITREITASKKGGKIGFWNTFFDQLHNEGFLSFYNSLFPAILLCINPAITYVIFEVLKARFLRARKIESEVLSTYEALVVSVIAKSIATISTFPLMRAKVMMAVQKKTEDQDKQSMFGMMAQIAQKEGVKGWYVGLQTQLIKGVTGAAIMLVIKENIYMIIKKMIIGQQKK
uniref:ADP,ATP carrier protein n=1 Tax=Paramoeba aestuarina TaxID=180227 RepID=A0A7S4KZK1_9EUKA|mmetsp:Transcript_28770/g.44511  ORF Transcript_28770/g.44511 Transcript_28770/m.44511 type:complete len:296 (+) Transcript_28770:73-960(+)|eukprot:CAMPEP_0201516868 /NCGR_PEP_ID=MMETSP0161_2-20130828/8101_1 /ASSEMBLY_ACC=CAM_ASM_000251 /TAXON_ID=180227 /ORGANISM="Neoparamoeba aestuarina, Strain SoJaBio B1-5/56/2" /LENGTH=295 /DNA_ID=CAMNT_0047914161 /DNA_START=77 /DNA_END=964 /DNA_ORIENTATION=+